SEQTAGDHPEPPARLVDVELVRTEVVGDIKVGVSVVVQIAGTHCQAPAMIARADVALLESAALVVIESASAAIVGVVPGAMHDVEHAAVTRILGTGELEHVEARWSGVAGQPRVEGAADHQ